jgi:hypothetical protein
MKGADTKVFLAAMALAIAVAPAFGQTESRKAKAKPAAQGQSQLRQAPNAVTPHNPFLGPSTPTNRAHEVYSNGLYIGSDPDAWIRGQMRRESDDID